MFKLIVYFRTGLSVFLCLGNKTGRLLALDENDVHV